MCASGSGPRYRTVGRPVQFRGALDQHVAVLIRQRLALVQHRLLIHQRLRAELHPGGGAVDLAHVLRLMRPAELGASIMDLRPLLADLFQRPDEVRRLQAAERLEANLLCADLHRLAHAALLRWVRKLGDLLLGLTAREFALDLIPNDTPNLLLQIRRHHRVGHARDHFARRTHH